MPKGIIVIGPSSHSGCTLTTGAIAATLKSLKFHFKTIKPLIFGQNQREADFLALVTKDQIGYPVQVLETYSVSSKKELDKLLQTCEGILQPIILDSPCPIAQPILGYNYPVDMCDFSNSQRWPLVITALAGKSMYNDFKLAIEHAKSKNTTIVGIIATCPYEGCPVEEKEDELQKISAEYGLNPLGIIPYSPSISIQELNQGNIIKITSSAIDLLPVQQALDLCVKI